MFSRSMPVGRRIFISVRDDIYKHAMHLWKLRIYFYVRYAGGFRNQVCFFVDVFFLEHGILEFCVTFHFGLLLKFAAVAVFFFK